MITGAAPILEGFQADLGKARHLLELTKEFKLFAAASAPTDGTPWEEAEALLTASQLVRTDLPLLSGSLLLYICGRFEYFARSLAEAVAEELMSNASDFDTLPRSLRDAFVTATTQIVKSPGSYPYIQATPELLLIELGRSLDTDVQGIEVRTELVALTDANMNQRVLADLFKRVGVEVWTEAAKQASLKQELQQAGDADCRQSATSRLDQVMRTRNSIAHPTSQTVFPDPDQVLETCRFLDVLARVIVDVANLPTA